MQQEDWGQNDTSWKDEGGGVATADADCEFDAGKADAEKVGGRGTVDKPGKYHFEIVDVKPDLATVNDNGQPHTPCVNFTLRVLESVPGQSPAGAVTWHRLYVGEKGGGPPKQACLDAIVDFLVACGILAMRKTPAGGVEFINPRTGTDRFTVHMDMIRAKTEQFIGQMKLEKDKQSGDQVLRFPFSGGAWRLDAEAVSDVPKNRDSVDLWNPPAGGRGEVRFPAGEEKPKRGRPAKNAAAPVATATPQATPAVAVPVVPAAAPAVSEEEF